MSKTTKKELQRAIQRQESRIDGVVGLLAKRGYYDKEPKSQLKQLDQSIFDGLDEKWQFAAVDDDGRVYAFMQKPIIDQDSPWFIVEDTTKCNWVKEGYDASNWRNSLIERDSSNELAEVDLAATPNDFKKGDLVFELDFANGIKLANLEKAGRFASEGYDFQTRYGYNYLKDGRAYPIFSIPHLMHATTENRKALVTLYGEKAVPQLPSETATGAA